MATLSHFGWFSGGSKYPDNYAWAKTVSQKIHARNHPKCSMCDSLDAFVKGIASGQYIILSYKVKVEFGPDDQYFHICVTNRGSVLAFYDEVKSILDISVVITDFEFNEKSIQKLKKGNGMDFCRLMSLISDIYDSQMKTGPTNANSGEVALGPDFSEEVEKLKEEAEKLQAEKTSLLAEKKELAQKLENMRNDCCICFDPIVARAALIPCGHSVFCQGCANKLKTSGKCPICAQAVTSCLRLF